MSVFLSQRLIFTFQNAQCCSTLNAAPPAAPSCPPPTCRPPATACPWLPTSSCCCKTRLQTGQWWQGQGWSHFHYFDWEIYFCMCRDMTGGGMALAQMDTSMTLLRGGTIREQDHTILGGLVQMDTCMTLWRKGGTVRELELTILGASGQMVTSMTLSGNKILVGLWILDGFQYNTVSNNINNYWGDWFNISWTYIQVMDTILFRLHFIIC